jgi:hypothetical protein
MRRPHEGVAGTGRESFRRRWPIGPAAYLLWAALAVGGSIALAGLTAESVTRLLVLAFLGLQFAFRTRLAAALPSRAPAVRFVALGTALAAVVEGFHMISKPVFASLRVGPGTGLPRALQLYALDLLFTLPAYLVIFSVIFFFVARYRYGTWAYAVGLAFAQAIGDGGLFFFANAPWMLVFLPYPMTNYHAVNVVPFLAVRAQGSPRRPAGAAAWAVVPAVVATYLVCGALIKAMGRWTGLEPG